MQTISFHDNQDTLFHVPVTEPESKSDHQAEYNQVLHFINNGKYLSSSTLDKIYEVGTLHVRSAVAEHSNVNVDTIKDFLNWLDNNHPDKTHLYCGAMRNDKTPSYLLDHYYNTSPDHCVRGNALRSSNATLSLLCKGLLDVNPNGWVRTVAKVSIRNRKLKLPKEWVGVFEDDALDWCGAWYKNNQEVVNKYLPLLETL